MSTIDESSRLRARAWQLLDSPAVWGGLRLMLDAAFGLYRRRISILGQWGVLDGAPSVLDVGCGTGEYAMITAGPYLGVDVTERYIERARRRHRRHVQREFRAADAATLEAERRTFDIVLMVDFLHHLDDASCDSILATAARLSRRFVISFEPVTGQHNRVGRWIVDHDRGGNMRSLDSYHRLFELSPLVVERSDELRLGPIGTQALLASVPREQRPNAIRSR